MRYQKSEYYPNIIWDNEKRRYITNDEIIEKLNHQYHKTNPCKECWGETVTIEDILTDTSRCNFCDVPYCFLEYINKRFFK